MREFIIKENRLSEKERRNLNILDSIRRGREISRAEVSKLTDLNIVTVSNYVMKYIKDRIVFETGLDISTGGRRPELLKLNPEYGYSIGIDLGSPHITANTMMVGVLTDLTGKIIVEEKVKKENEAFDKLASRVLGMVDTLVKKSTLSLSSIKGIGVGIWGVIDRYKNTVRYAVEKEEIVSYTNLVSQLESKFKMNVTIEHDALLAAFGERWSGIGESSSAENLVFMCSDSSCGLIVKGDLYYGSTKSAGELNINPPYTGENSSPKNCWTSYDYGCCLRSRGIDLGIPGNAARLLSSNNPKAKSLILEFAGGTLDNININHVVEAQEKGDTLARNILEEAGDYLGVKIAFLVNLFNPEIVVIGRGIEKAGDIFFSSVRKSVKKWAYEESVKVVKIVPTSLGDSAVAMGAAALVVQDIFAKA